MSKVKFELNTKAVGEILKSNEMLKLVEKTANNIGNSENIKVFVGFDRAKAIIYPDTKEK